MTLRTRGRIAIWAGAAALVAGGALALPFGANTDEALFVLLARQLRAGSFRVPGALGWTVTDPWPGFPLVLSPFEWLAGTHWFLYRLLGLLIWAAFAAAAWKLARRFAAPADAGLAALAAALCPAVAGQAGLMMPDLAFAALAAFALAAFAEDGENWAWAAAASLAALMRPHGALLLAALAAASWLGGRRRRAVLACAAGLPLALLLVRNRLAAGTITAYAAHWAAQPSAGFAQRAGGLLSSVLGDGLLGFSFLPRWAAVAAGAAALGTGAWSVRRWLSRTRAPAAVAAALFAGAVLAVHCEWTTALPRYAAPLAAIFWTALFAAGARWGRAFAFAVLAACGVSAAGRALALPSAAATIEPQTMAWIAASTPTDARFASFAAMPIRLFTGREAAAPAADSRDAWLAWLLRRRVDYVHVFTLRASGYFPKDARLLAASTEVWARSLPFFSDVYENRAEQSAVFRFSHPAPERFMSAWADFEAAGRAARAGAPAEAVLPLLDRALKLEPDLAIAWAARATLQTDPSARLSDFKKAAAADPTSASIREDLAGAKNAVRRFSDDLP